MEINKIHCMDCIEGMKQLPDNSVDIVITSPPYNISTRIHEGNLYNEYEDDLTEEEYYEWITKVIKECIRTTRYTFFNFQILSNNKLPYLQIIGDFKKNIKDIIIWHKKQSPPSIMETALSSAFEFIIVFTNEEEAKTKAFKQVNFNNRQKGQHNINIIHGNNAGVKEPNHNKTGMNKATFPQYFAKWFIDKFTQENSLVMDPFMGSGTTGIVCKLQRRNFIGFDIDADQVKSSNKHINSLRLLEDNKWF